MKTSEAHLGNRPAIAAALAALLVLAAGGWAWAATPHPMSAGPYYESFTDIPNWTDGFAAGAGAERWLGLPINANGVIPDGVRIGTPTQVFASGTAGGVQRGSSGSNPPGTIVLLVTGTTDNTNSAAIDLLLDFSGVTAGYLSFDWASVNNSTGNRNASMRVYWSTDGAAFTEIPAAAVLNYTNNAPTSGRVSVPLPSALDSAAGARLRFYCYNGVGGTTGSRPKLALDNLSVTAAGQRVIAAGGTWGGTVSPSGPVAVADGASQTFDFTPDAGFAVRDVKVDGVSQGPIASYTFPTVTENHTVTATFGGSPAGWWPMNQDAGVLAPDSTGNGNDATVQNGGTWAPGADGNALALDRALEQYAATGPAGPSLAGANELTVAAWVRPASRATMPVIAKETVASRVWGYSLALSGSAPYYPSFRLDNDTGGSGRLDGVTPYPVDGGWMHLAATYDGATMKLYVNGVLDSSQPRAGALPTNALAVALGAQSTGEPGRFLDGAIDDARIYGYALDAGEIAALATHPLNVTTVGAGTVERSPEQTAYPHATTVDLTAVPDPGWQFVGWSGDTTATSNPLTVAMNRTREITATFAQPTFTIAASAGPGGVIDPAGDVTVVSGESATFTITPDPGHAIADVLVDGSSAGAVSSYTFPNVTDDHTIAATFLAVGTVDLGPVAGPITLAVPTQVVPVRLTRGTADPALMAFSVTFRVPAPLVLPAGRNSIEMPAGGGFLNADGGRTLSLQTEDLGGGVYRADATTLGQPCGSTALTGEIFNITVSSDATGGAGTVEVLEVRLRDCLNRDITPSIGSPVTILVDRSPPAVAVTTPNGGETWHVGETKQIAWTGSDPEGVASYDVAYSIDGGATYPPEQVIATGLPPGQTSLDWLVPPEAVTTAGRVLVSARDVNGNTGADASDDDFTVLSGFTLLASAGPHGSISPEGPVTVAYGGSQTFSITADDCYDIADVLVDGVSVGAVAGHTFEDVTADHTIAATFAIRTYTIAASAGPGGTISPAGDVTLECGSEQTFAIAADAGFAIAEVLVDGDPVGPVESYTFSDVRSNGTIAATFRDVRPPVISDVAAAPTSSSAVVSWLTDEPATSRVDYGASPGMLDGNVTDGALVGARSLEIAGLSQATTYYYRVTSVDAAGNPATYPPEPEPPLSFTTAIADSVAAVAPPGAVISAGTPCLAVPVVFTRSDPTPLRGFSVTLELSPNLTLCGAQFTSGEYPLAPRQMLTTPLGGNRWTIDEATLGESCGAVGSATLFFVHVASSEPSGVGTITVLSVLARDCANHSIPAAVGPVAAIPIDNVGPARTLNLAAIQVKSGNHVPPPGTNDRTAIQLTFSLPADAATVEVYRKPFGQYPQYDEAGGVAPSLPASLPAAGWELTGVTASGQADEPAVRDYWYYALITKDAHGNPSPVSNMTGGTLDYHLGDVHDGATECAGDDQVTEEDVAFLQAHYGTAIPPGGALECLDVGPTLDHSTNTRPTTDNLIEFEDLMMFALNFGGVSAPAVPLHEAMQAGDPDRLVLGLPLSVSPGEVFDVSLSLVPSGLLQGLSIQLGWNPEAVEHVSTTPSGLFAADFGVDWTPGPGGVDGALLGVRAQGLSTAGPFGVVRFRALTGGDPTVYVAAFRARDRFNAPLPLVTAVTGAEGQAPRRTALAPAQPSPFSGSTMVEYALASRGRVDLALFAIDGRRVRSLHDGLQEAGVYRLSWDGADDHGRTVPAGVYFLRLDAGGQRLTRTLVRLAR